MDPLLYLVCVLGLIILVLNVFIARKLIQPLKGHEALIQEITHRITAFEKSLLKDHSDFRDTLYQNQLKGQSQLNEQIHQASQSNYDSQIQLQKSLSSMLNESQERLSQNFDKLSHLTEERLKHIGAHVQTQLGEGFEKTQATFSQITQRLALIDEAQKKITLLSQNVVSLQEILVDKRSRGAFGEIQLKHLIENAMPKDSYAFQHSLSNGLRVDCMLFLPPPSGDIAIDAKFPLESYQTFTDFSASEATKTQAKQQFKQDIKKHIIAISEKYILPETTQGALMFIPAEAIFAEIHGHHPDLLDFAYQKKVWLASPTTMMAILNTANTVIREFATRNQMDLIQKHLRSLSKDFVRFEKRMDNLAKHLKMANDDATLVHTSAKKITQRFAQIDKVELEEIEPV